MKVTMKVKATMNPLALSNLLSDLSVGPHGVEGLLFGEKTKLTSTTIQDNAADRVHDTFQINITGHFSQQIGLAVDLEDELLSFDHRIKQIDLNPFLNGVLAQGGFPVGWFRFTSRPVSVPNMPSQHDYLKHKILLNSLRGGDNNDDDEAPFVFLSLSNTFNEHLHTGIGGFDRTLFRLNPSPDGGPGNVESLELDIPNLGDTDATKRYLCPLPDSGGPTGSKFERGIVDKQQNFVHDLTRYGTRRVEHCQGIFRNYVEMYDAFEGPLHREIYQLERQLNPTTVPTNQDRPQIVAAAAVATTSSVTKTEADKFFDAKDARSDDGLLDDSNGLPSPPIGNSQRSNDDDALLYSDADDQVIPETQFEASFKNNGEDKSDNDSNDIPPHQSMGLGNLSGETKNRHPNAGDAIEASKEKDDGSENGPKKRKLEAVGDGDGDCRGGGKTAPKKEAVDEEKEDDRNGKGKGKGKGKNSQPRATANTHNNNADGKNKSKNQQHRRNDDDDDDDDDDDEAPDVMTRKKLRETRDKSPSI